jgi:hypothetical protein
MALRSNPARVQKDLLLHAILHTLQIVVLDATFVYMPMAQCDVC